MKTLRKVYMQMQVYMHARMHAHTLTPARAFAFMKIMKMAISACGFLQNQPMAPMCMFPLYFCRREIASGSLQGFTGVIEEMRNETIRRLRLGELLELEMLT